MAAEKFNDTFWAAIAAAAPVIGLAAAVTMQQNWDRATKRASKEGAFPAKFLGATYVVAFVNVLLQTFALGLALESLSKREDLFGKRVAIYLEWIGMFLIFLPIVFSFFAGIDTAPQSDPRDLQPPDKADE